MTQESPTPREEIRAPVAQMLVVGAIASALGIGLGLLIEWFPEQGSSQADDVDLLYDILIVVSVPVFVLVTIIVLYSVLKFRMRPGEEELDGPPLHGNTRLEVIWTTIPAVVLVALCSYAYVVLTDIEESKAGEMRVNVTGQQFTWTFEYPMGEGQEPVRSGQLYLPKDRPVRFFVRSLDVIHDFWVPQFRMKVDAVPGITTKYRVTPIRTGRYEVVCAELCGPGHAFMRQSANVISEDAFTAWLRRQQQPDQAAPAGAGDAASIDGKALFTEGNGDSTACGACHTLADADTTATTGPSLDEVIPGQDAAALEESIVQPGAKLSSGFQNGIMPPNYGDTLSDEERKALVDYLLEAAGK